MSKPRWLAAAAAVALAALAWRADRYLDELTRLVHIDLGGRWIG